MLLPHEGGMMADAGNRVIESHVCMTMGRVQVTSNCTAGRCLIGDERAGQCRPHHHGPSFAHHANNCQATGPPLCCGLIDSFPLTRFMGVRTFLPVASNWSTVPLARGPGPWPASGPLMNDLRHGDGPARVRSHEDEPAVFE